MKIVQCDQGGAEWLALHVGRPTASQFHRIMSPKKQEWAAATEGYRNELLAEEITGHPLNDFVTDLINRGKELEDDARAFYEITREVKVEQVGFVLRDDGRTGCSPDGLVGSDGGLEIKVPNAAKHVGYALEGFEDNYICQVQGSIWLCERDYWDALSFNPDIKSVCVRYNRDDAFIKKLAANVDRFIEYLDISRDKLIRDGFIKNPLRMVA